MNDEKIVRTNIWKIEGIKVIEWKYINFADLVWQKIILCCISEDSGSNIFPFEFREDGIFTVINDDNTVISTQNNWEMQLIEYIIQQNLWDIILGRHRRKFLIKIPKETFYWINSKHEHLKG